MSIVRVNPESVSNYGNTASQQFERMRGELEQLTREVVAVRYFGPNAQQFKTKSGELAVTFANALMNDLNSIAEAVRQSTSNIAASLGGRAVTINFNGAPLPPPEVPAPTDFVDVDTSALEQLRPVVTARFAALEEALQQHLTALERTDWEGQAKQGAVEAVNRFTVSARGKASEAQNDLNQTIEQQISAVVSADR